MTTLGKILVFLVFFAALALGGLMIYVAKTTPNWAEAVKDRDDYIKVLKANAQAEADGRKRWVQEYEKMKQLLDSQVIEARGVQERLKLDIKDREKQAQEAQYQAKKSDLNHKQAQAEAERLQKELLFVQNVVAEREKTIIQLQAEIVTAKNDEQAAKNNATTATARTQSLMAQVREKDALIAKLMGDKNGPTQVAFRVNDANYSNPPSKYMEGIIQKVDDKDKKLVQISLGSDDGLQKDQTLEVFRKSPKAEYLGRLLIVDANFRYSLARLLPQPGSPPVTLMPGDEVATKLRK